MQKLLSFGFLVPAKYSKVINVRDFFFGGPMYEKIGRYLCWAYYTGRLKPSTMYKAGDHQARLAQCVERAFLTPNEAGVDKTGRHTNEKERNPLRSAWISLMSGDCAKLPLRSRSRVLGGWAPLEAIRDIFGPDWLGGASGLGSGITGIDGGKICLYELALYAEVGKNFAALCKG